MKNYAYNQVDEIQDIKDLLLYSARNYHDKVAFRVKSKNGYKEISYTKLFQDVNALGTGLLNLNLKDKHIAIIGENSYEWVVSFLSIINGVGVVVPIDKEISEEDVIQILTNSHTSAIIHSKTHTEMMNNIAVKLDDVIFIEIDEEVSHQKYYKYSNIKDTGERLLRDGDNRYIDTIINPEIMSVLLYTSGTTGKSKGVMLSHKNITSTIVAALKTVQIEKVCLSVLPIHHSFELTCGILTSIYNGVTICINDDLKYFLNNLKLFKPSFIYLVPLFVETMMKKIWQEAEKTGKAKLLKKLIKISNALLKTGIDIRRILFKKIHSVFGGNLKLIVCGGASLNPKLIEDYRNFGITLLNGYGITECSPLISVNRRKFYNVDSVGVVVPCCKVKIDQPNEHGEGEILVSGANVMLGYYKDEAATKKAFSNEWFKTGDIGKLDNDGFIYITGRKKDIIILSNGKNVYPQEIEQTILQSPVVKEVVVYALTDKEHTKESLVAEIYPDFDYIRDNKINNIEDYLRHFIINLNTNQPPYKKVHDIRIRHEEFEKTTTKKIKRHKIEKKDVTENIYVPPTNELEKIMVEIIADLLDVDNVSIADNILNIGIDSLDALRFVCELETKGYHITIKDVYNHPKIKSLASYITDIEEEKKNSVFENAQDDLMYEDITDIKEFEEEQSVMSSVLLTGATGFLGVHILSELIDNTNTKIYCLVRNPEKMYDVLKYYHGEKYHQEINKRIILIKGDITEVFFGLNKDDYALIINSIDQLIHCAADVRHFGKWEDLEKVNVEGTKNAIQVAKYANCKLQYISTLSVSGEELVKQTRGIINFNEDMLYVGQKYSENVYVHSKFLAECRVIDAIRSGDIQANIFRVGNVTWRYHDGKIQKNDHENWFCQLTKAFSILGVIPVKLGKILIDLTPVDKSAVAIVKLLQKTNNNIFHIYNPHELTMKDYLSYYEEMKDITLEDFERLIISQNYNDTMGILLTYARMVSDNLNENELIPNVDKSCEILKELDFEWPIIDETYLKWYKTEIK